MSEQTLTQAAMDAFDAEAKVGLLATLDAKGRPHVSLITSLLAKSPDELIWGQFFEGCSKDNIRRDPRAGFLVMSLGRDIWRGSARWTGETGEGDEYVRLNNLSLFRYNSYVNVHKVHFMDLVEVSGREKLDIPGMVAGSVPLALGGLGRSLLKRRSPSASGPLNPWVVAHLRKLDTLKFLAYVDGTGFPAIVPSVAAWARDAASIDIALNASQRRIAELGEGAEVALFALDLQMESVLIRGTLTRDGGRGRATLVVDWVYNSMPPFPGRIYPPKPLEKCRFEGCNTNDP